MVSLLVELLGATAMADGSERSTFQWTFKIRASIGEVGQKDKFTLVF